MEELIMAKEKVVFHCTNCGNESPKWQGKCFGCGEWNTLVEEKKMTGKAAKGVQTTIIATGDAKAKKLSDIDKTLYDGYDTGLDELNRVLGGQLVKGSVTLLGGEPGLGKSTLLSSLANNLAKYGKILYSSGEESEGQGKKRFDERMKITNDNIYLLHTSNIEVLEKNVEELEPTLLIVDSIQAIGDPTIASNIGSVSQVQACSGRIIHLAKSKGIPVFMIGQVLKDNKIAGPRTLEHAVDTVLFLEGDDYSDMRIVRVEKNRLGSTSELGVFQMKSSGMVEIKNPSEYLLSDRPENASGSAVVCISDTRPLLIEVQALVSPPIMQNSFPKRRTHGFAQQRLDIVLSVLEKRLQQHKLAYKDVIVNVVGGMKIDQPSADLGVAMAIYSSEVDKPIDPSGNTKTVILGEVGLTGEVRPIGKAEQLVKEAEKVGFTHCILPKKSYEQVKDVIKDIKLQPVRTIEEAIKLLF